MSDKHCIVCGEEATMSGASMTNDGLLHHACRSEYLRSKQRIENDQDGRIEEADVSTGSVLPSEYGAARGVSGVGEFFGWLLVLLGVVLAFISFARDMGAVGLIMALGVSVSGFFLVMMAQFVRATVNNADTSREILRLLQTKTQ